MALLLGARADDTYYVCLEVNPRVEFLTNSKGKVKSVKPINEDAKILLINEDFVGKDMADVAVKWIDLCERAGYIDVTGKDNAIKVTVLAGLTQRFESDIVSKVYKKLSKDNVYCVVTENQNDLHNFKSAKKQSASPEKYDLMLAVTENGGYKMEDLKSKNSRELIDIIAKQHEEYKFSYTADELALKQSLMDANKQKYDEHMASINDSTTKKFRTEYDKYLKENTHPYDVNFAQCYDKWASKQ